MSRHFKGYFKIILMDRCRSGSTTIQLLLNNGFIIECKTDDVDFFDDHLRLSVYGSKYRAKIIYPTDTNIKLCEVRIPYKAISFVSDVEN